MRLVLKVIGAVLGTVWALPLTVCGMFVAVVYQPLEFKWYKGALVCRATRVFGYITDMSGKRIPIEGSTFGNIIFIAKDSWERLDDPKDRLLPHEFVHVTQCWFWGLLLVPLTPLAWLQSWLSGGFAYKDSLFETQAQRISQRYTK